MSVLYIVMSVIFGLMILGGIFYISYLIESRKKRNALLTARANDKIQKYQRFLDFFQGNTLPKDIKLILIEEILSNVNIIKKVNPEDPRIQRLSEQAEAQHKDILKSPDKAPQAPKANDLAAAKEIQRQFKNLFKLLNFIGKNRKHHRKAINQHLKGLQTLFIDTGVNVHRGIAEAAIKQSKEKLALYHLNQAVGEYARIDSKRFAPQIKALRTQIQGLEKRFKNQPAPQPEQTQAKADKKDRGLDRMFDQQAAMKAKRNMN